MNECVDTRRLSAYLDDEVSPDERRLLDRHVMECSACARELARLRAIGRFLRAGAGAELSPEALGRLRHRVIEQPRRGLVRLVTRLTAAAAAVLLFCVGWLGHAEYSTPATRSGEPPWAEAAVTRSLGVEAGSSAETRLALWMTEGLSTESTHD